MSCDFLLLPTNILWIGVLLYHGCAICCLIQHYHKLAPSIYIYSDSAFEAWRNWLTKIKMTIKKFNASVSTKSRARNAQLPYAVNINPHTESKAAYQWNGICEKTPIHKTEYACSLQRCLTVGLRGGILQNVSFIRNSQHTGSASCGTLVASARRRDPTYAPPRLSAHCTVIN